MSLSSFESPPEGAFDKVSVLKSTVFGSSPCSWVLLESACERARPRDHTLVARLPKVSDGSAYRRTAPSGPRNRRSILVRCDGKSEVSCWLCLDVGERREGLGNLRPIQEHSGGGGGSKGERRAGPL